MLFVNISCGIFVITFLKINNEIVRSTKCSDIFIERLKCQKQCVHKIYNDDDDKLKSRIATLYRKWQSFDDGITKHRWKFIIRVVVVCCFSLSLSFSFYAYLYECVVSCFVFLGIEFVSSSAKMLSTRTLFYWFGLNWTRWTWKNAVKSEHFDLLVIQI